MSLPGPPGALWAVALLAFALETAVVGEPLRWLASRWVPLWRAPEPVERFLLDFVLGGAVLYLVAAIPSGGFGPIAVFGLPVGAAAVLAAGVGFRRQLFRAGMARVASALARPGTIVAIASALGLFAVELWAALGAGTGNTYDSSLLTTYTALLLDRGTIPLSFHPYAAPMILYPQGTTVWLGAAQLLFGLPAARTSLLVTPLFLSLSPLAGFVFGRKMFGTDRAGAAVALVMGWLGPGTRALVGGSNDFAFAFPVVLLLAAQSTIWMPGGLPGWGDTVGFGLLCGYSAAINPVGAEWLLPVLLGVGLIGAGRRRHEAGRWLARWGVSLGVSVVPVLPSLDVLWNGLHSPGYVPGSAGPPSPLPTGITGAQWVGSVDPFLFRAKDVMLSPVPTLRAELAVLLVLGAIVLLLASRFRSWGGVLGRFRRWALSSIVGLVGGLTLLLAARSGVAGATAVSPLTSGAELSMWLFTVYSLVGSVPLVLLLERLSDTRRSERRNRPRPAEPPGPRWTVPREAVPVAAVFPLVAVLIVVAPGVVLTPTQLEPVLASLYSDFGNVSPGDFALLSCAGAHLPAGSRVLVAPGSAAEFLPGYARQIVLLYPLVPGWPWVNPSYTVVVSELTNGTLGPEGRAALGALHVDYIAVTMQNTILWPAFVPQPLLSDPGHFTEVFRSGDAYLFADATNATPFQCG